VVAPRHSKSERRKPAPAPPLRCLLSNLRLHRLRNHPTRKRPTPWCPRLLLRTSCRSPETCDRRRPDCRMGTIANTSPASDRRSVETRGSRPDKQRGHSRPELAQHLGGCCTNHSETRCINWSAGSHMRRIHLRAKSRSRSQIAPRILANYSHHHWSSGYSAVFSDNHPGGAAADRQVAAITGGLCDPHNPGSDVNRDTASFEPGPRVLSHLRIGARRRGPAGLVSALSVTIAGVMQMRVAP
jgi:hypothetical protein